MALPDKSALIGADVTEQGFKNGLGQILDVVKFRENLSHLYDSEAELKSVKLEQLKLKAKALDTGKVYEWTRLSADGVTPILGTWIDTGLSEKDQAIDFAKKLIVDKIGSIGDVSSLFDFNDINDQTVVIIKENGDIVNPNFSFNEIGGKTKEISEEIGNKLDNLNEANQSKSLYEFNDNQNRTVASIENDGDITYAGGRSLIKDISSLEKSHFISGSMAYKESVTLEYANLLNMYAALNSATQVRVFTSASKQNYTIKNTSDFLNLKISEPTLSIAIDTPYYDSSSAELPHSQVVHPYLCEFVNKPFGFKYILLLTPFHFTNDQFENPVVYGSNDLLEFTMLTAFEQPIAKPIVGQNYNYNSDNFAVFDHTTSEFCIFYRNTELSIDKKTIIKSRLFVRKTSNFINWSQAQEIVGLVGEVLSPSIVYNPTLKKWMIHYVDFSGNGTETALYYCTSDYLEKGWSAPIKIEVPASIKPWHQEVRFAGNHFICILHDLYSVNAIAGEGDLFTGISLDGVSWQFSTSIFSGAFKDPYKASISPEIINDKVFFNILWTSCGNKKANEWKLFSAKTEKIEVI